MNSLKRSHAFAAVATICLVTLSSACGDMNPYKKREPHCKSNCKSDQETNVADQNSENQNAGGDGTKRESLKLPLDARFWTNKIPLTTLSDSEVVSLLLSHPIVQLNEGQSGYQKLGISLSAGFKALQTSINTAASIDSNTVEKNPTARCYKSEFEQNPAKAENAAGGYLFKAEPGLCFSNDQITASIQQPDPATASSTGQGQGLRAIAYEDTMQLYLPEDQQNFSLSQVIPMFHLKELGTAANIPPLEILKTGEANFTQASLQHLQIQGIEITNNQKLKTYELNWDFFSAGNTETKEILSLSSFSQTPESTPPVNSGSTDSNTQAAIQGLLLKGTLTHSSGHSLDRQRLTLNGSMELFTYVRIITFQDFRLWYSNGQLPQSLEAAFDKKTPALLSGRFVVEIPQPQNTLVFTAVASGQPCLVEFFAGEDTEKPENSLGVRDLCVSTGSSP